MARIAVGGIQHETNTFASTRADYEAFEVADAWPGLVAGAALAPAVAGVNLPIAGFIDAARHLGHDIQPLLWCSAQPSGKVTRDAFERIIAELLRVLELAPRVDAVYLDLHGAMVSEHSDNADAEILRRVRARVGNHVPVVANLDFHANVGSELVEAADTLLAYRTYPHTDMAAAGNRAAACVDRMLGSTRPPHRHLVQIPFLIPLTAQCTLVEPFATIVQQCADLEGGPVQTLNVTAGFPLADVPDCGPAVFGYGTNSRRVRETVEHLAAQIRQREPECAGRWLETEEATRRAVELAIGGQRPVVLADTQDNPGAGGDADTTSLLKSLLTHGARRVVAGIFCDPTAAARAHAVGVGGTFDGQIGGRVGFGDETPLTGRFIVASLGDGRFLGTGPFYRGAQMQLGLMAQLILNDTRIVVASRKQQAADQAMFRHVGIEPSDYDILLLKSSVHFRADFGAIARNVIVVTAPGPSPADPGLQTYRRLRPGVRLRPTGTSVSITE